MGDLGSVLVEQAPGQVDKSYHHFLAKCSMGLSLDGHILRREAYPPRPRPYKELIRVRFFLRGNGYSMNDSQETRYLNLRYTRMEDIRGHSLRNTDQSLGFGQLHSMLYVGVPDTLVGFIYHDHTRQIDRIFFLL
jgi:hypothetical protein